MISEIDEDTRVTDRGDGVLDAVLSDRWSNGNGRLNGGYQLALLLRTLTAVAAEHGRPDPVVASASFLRPAVPGPASVTTELVRVGRRLATVAGVLRQPGADGADRDLLRLEAGFGDLAVTAPERWDGDRPPALPSPESCRDLWEGPGADRAVPVAQRVVIRVPEAPGWRRGVRSGDPSAEFWVSFADGSDVTPWSLAFVVDCAMPVVAELTTAPSSTAQLTVHLREHPAPGPLACRVRTRHVGHGLHEEDFEVWDSTGVLCAQSRQLAVLNP